MWLMIDRFYKSQGYVPVYDFEAKDPVNDDGSVWHGKLLRLDVGENAR